jgi:hypothetical protein
LREPELFSAAVVVYPLFLVKQSKNFARR